MQIVLTGIVEYDHTDDSKTLPGRMTIKGDKVILWGYDYGGNKIVYNLKRKAGEKMYYERKRDTSGKYFELLTEFTADYCWDRWSNGTALGEFIIQTWDRKRINVKVKREVKKEMVSVWVDDFVLDTKSQALFNDWINCVVNAE